MNPDGTLRFAPHLGYLSQDDPLFRVSVGGVDPVAHIAFAAEHGFAGIFDPWMIARPTAEIERIVAALPAHGMRSAGITYAPFGVMFKPLLVTGGATAWTEIAEHLDRAIDLAKRVGSETVIIVPQGTGEVPRHFQEEIAAGHLRRAGDRAAAAGLVIGLEHMIALPDILLDSTETAIAFLERTAHPAVRLVFDTGHVAAMDGDIHSAWRLARDHVCVLQIADMPGRVEPGAGTLDLVAFLAQAVRDGKAGDLIELEHGWAQSSVESEQAAFAALRRIEADVRAVVANDGEKQDGSPDRDPGGET